MAFDNSVFVDTSAFKAVLDEKDDFHLIATRVWADLLKKDTLLVTSNFIVDETLTLIRIRCGLAKAKEFKEKIINSLKSLKIVRVMSIDERNAWHWFINEWKDLSFTDCVSFAVMERLGLEKVASFDQHFAKAGFKIVE